MSYGVCALLRSRSSLQQRFKMSLTVYPDIFWVIFPFVAKCSMEMHHYEPECHVKNAIFKVTVILSFLLCLQHWWSLCNQAQSVMWKMICYLQGQGHSVGSYYRFCCVFSAGDPFAIKLSLTEHHHKPDCLVKRPQIALFKVKFIMTVQQITEYLSILYFLYYWSLQPK